MAQAVASSADIFPRGTGLLIIEVRHSNPNGDPDAESEPRTIDTDGRGLISPVSFKRKLRDLVGAKDGAAWEHAANLLALVSDNARSYDILETRGRIRSDITAMDRATFVHSFWDGRIFGNTFLEEAKDATTEASADDDSKSTMRRKGSTRKGNASESTAPSTRDHFISTGVVQFGPGISVSPVEIERLTMTSKAGVQEGKDRGMAPLGWRVVRHGVYTMPFFVNPMMARKTGCTSTDVDLLKLLLPHAYSATASAIRPFVEIRHAWYAEHKSPLGSCPDSMILDALTPTRSNDSDKPSSSVSEYQIPEALPDPVLSRLASFEDLCARDWASATA